MEGTFVHGQEEGEGQSNSQVSAQLWVRVGPSLGGEEVGGEMILSLA